jgi:biotin operon repressor
MPDHLWEIALLVIGLLLSGIGTLLGMNLQSIKKCIKNLSERIDKQGYRIDEVEKLGNQLAKCQVECTRNYVSKEDWVRSEALTRQKLGEVAETLARINGKLDVVEQLPNITGKIAREIAIALKSGDE